MLFVISRRPVKFDPVSVVCGANHAGQSLVFYPQFLAVLLNIFYTHTDNTITVFCPTVLSVFHLFPDGPKSHGG